MAQWRAFVEETGYKSTAEETRCMVLKDGEWEIRKVYHWQNPGFSQGLDHPVTCLSWKDAQAFAEWMSEKAEGDFRLPGRYGHWFSWGDRADCDKGNFGNSWTNECRRKEPRKEPLRTVETASDPANPWGLHDMHGSAGEWTGDWSDEYPKEPVTDPTRPDWGERKAVRGGSWWSYSRYCRSAARVRNSPDQAFQTLGFRLVMTK